jgi:cell division septum initiation protein DivIVA
MAASPGNPQDIDLEEVRKLLDVLERDLEHVSDDSNAVQRLKDEVQTLRNVLESPVRRHHWVRDSLHGIREAFGAAGAAGAKASQYVAEIGRILGM